MTLIYGHRGAKGEAPENTLASFQRCLEHGVNRCELDLHLSRDGELMVIHDPTLKRTTGRRGKVAEHDAATWSPTTRAKAAPAGYGRRRSRGWRSCSRSARSSTGNWK